MRVHIYTLHVSSEIFDACRRKICAALVVVNYWTPIHTHIYSTSCSADVPDSCDTLHTQNYIHCDTLQHAATHCNKLQLTATHCSTLQHTATNFNSLQHTATNCNTLQHTATHCNKLQHTTTHCNTVCRSWYLTPMISPSTWVMSHVWTSPVTRIDESCQL